MEHFASVGMQCAPHYNPADFISMSSPNSHLVLFLFKMQFFCPTVAASRSNLGTGQV